jgi:MYXO-CTERM domain-containing protein
MDLSTAMGNVNVISSSSPDFSSTIITNNNTSNVTMTYSGGSVANGDTGDFLFQFTIPLSSIWSFTITQTPVPAPGAAGLVAVAGLVALRRRRLAHTIGATAQLMANRASAVAVIESPAADNRFAYAPAIAIGVVMAALSW